MRLTTLAAALLFATTSQAMPPCLDDIAVAAARAELTTSCRCEDASTRSSYLGCVRAVLSARVASGQLPAACRADARRCAIVSTCKRPGAVACCTTRGGTTRCQIRRSAAACQRGGGEPKACPSCCDACSDGCVAPTTTSTTSTTLPGIACGDSGYPQCGGACPGDQVCYPYAQNGPGAPSPGGCQCGSSSAQCATIPFGCSIGTCPNNGVCSAYFYSGGIECGCLPGVSTTTSGPTTTTTTLPQTGPCMQTGFPTCGGDCPAGEDCVPLRTTGPQISPDIQECRCAPHGVLCHSVAPNQCAVGDCPDGYVCSAYVDGGVECGCAPFGTTTTASTVAPTTTTTLP